MCLGVDGKGKRLQKIGIMMTGEKEGAVPVKSISLSASHGDS